MLFEENEYIVHAGLEILNNLCCNEKMQEKLIENKFSLTIDMVAV